jgi:hypothetical protein
MKKQFLLLLLLGYLLAPLSAKAEAWIIDNTGCNRFAAPRYRTGVTLWEERHYVRTPYGGYWVDRIDVLSCKKKGCGTIECEGHNNNNYGPNGWPSLAGWSFGGWDPRYNTRWVGCYGRVRFSWERCGKPANFEPRRAKGLTEEQPEVQGGESSIKVFPGAKSQTQAEYNDIEVEVTVTGQNLNEQFASSVFQVYKNNVEDDSTIELNANKTVYTDSRLIIKNGKIYYSGVFDPKNLEITHGGKGDQKFITVRANFSAIVKFGEAIDTNYLSTKLGTDQQNTAYDVPSKDFDTTPDSQELDPYALNPSSGSPTVTLNIVGNPADKDFKCVINTVNQTTGTAYLLNAYGMPVWSDTFSLQANEVYTNTIDTEGLQAGVYILRVVTPGYTTNDLVSIQH